MIAYLKSSGTRPWLVSIGLCSLFCLTLYFYQSVVTPIMVGGFLAYILSPLVNWIAKRVPVSRWVVVLAVLFVVIGVVGGIIAGLVPVISYQVVAIGAKIPVARDQIVNHFIPWMRETFSSFEILDSVRFDSWIAEFNIASQFGSPEATVSHLLSRFSTLLGGVVNILLIFIFSFFLLNDLPRIRQGFLSLIPEDLREKSIVFGREINSTLQIVLKRQLMVAFILGILYMVGFNAVGLRYSFAIGAIAGLCRIVPYFDVIVGTILSCIVLVTSPGETVLWTGLGVVIVFTVVQSIDGMFITPRVVGTGVGLHPGIIIASVFAFGDWFGFAGVLIAIPVLAVAKIVWSKSLTTYRTSPFFIIK